MTDVQQSQPTHPAAGPTGIFSKYAPRHRPFLALLAIVALSRFVVLFLSQTHVHSDEAIIGLMGKHIMEGRYFPFYMYGQPYNAFAAWEAYLAAVVFAVFGVGVVQLKSCIVVLSLAWLVLFYRLACQLYGLTIAWWSSLVLALLPSLFKWNFQVRGYSFYFLAIPLLTALFFSIESGAPSRLRRFFVFGLLCGLSVWGLELILPLVAAFWILLAVRRKLSLKSLFAALGGFVLGYLPAILYNLAHNFENWRWVFLDKTNAPSRLFHLLTVARIFLAEMPKFFGPDTVLWYYPEVPPIGLMFYAIAVAALIAALLPFIKAPVKIANALCPNAVPNDEHKDFLVFILALACFVPYLTAAVRVPSYFLGGCFFLSLLIGRLLCRGFASVSWSSRAWAIVLLLMILAGGVTVQVQTARHNQIETLTLNPSRELTMTRIPGKDLDAVEHYLTQNHIDAAWATVSFIYPLIFETKERLAVSGEIFGYHQHVYPPTVAKPGPDPDSCEVFVLETNSPFMPVVKARCAKIGGGPPRVTQCGTLTIVEPK